MTSVVWGPRSDLTKRDSFWLRPPVLVGDPVRVRAFARVPTREWLNPATGQPLTVANFRDRAESTFVLPDPLPAAVALDVDLRLEVDSVSGTGLRVRQLCTVGPGGVLLPARFARRDVTVTVVPNKGVTIADKPPVELVGTHPLLSFTTGQVRVDAEFLDITELWWGLRSRQTRSAEPRGDWYVHPALGGHPERLRYFAATTPGDGPLFWFAWVSQAAAEQAQRVQPLVFLIAPAWLNAHFAHKLSPAGLTAAVTSGWPLYAVGRFLLSPVPSDRLDAVRRATPPLSEFELWQLAARILRGTVPGMPGMRTRLWPQVLLKTERDAEGRLRAAPDAVLPLQSDLGHRPAGHEAAADGSGKPLLLVYPVGVNPQQPYGSVVRRGLAERMRSLVAAAFGAGAVATAATAAPATDDLILAGHSSGNAQMWISLANNGADIAKCVAFDAAGGATPERSLTNITTGAARRTPKPLTLVLVTSPNSYGTLVGLGNRVSTVTRALHGNPAARLVVLPEVAVQSEFWNPHKAVTGASARNPLLGAMLSDWTAQEVDDATKQGRLSLWGFLFLHEFAAYGGPSLTRTFFREALDL